MSHVGHVYLAPKAALEVTLVSGHSLNHNSKLHFDRGNQEVILRLLAEAVAYLKIWSDITFVPIGINFEFI